VSTIDVNPPTVSLTVGQRQTVAATPKSASGKSLTARQVQWSSSATNVALVDGAGSVLGVGAGTATITATAGSVSQQVAVTVTNPTFTLTITGGGNGNGTVTSNPAGINCVITNGTAAATGCSASFTLNTSVTLTATVASGSTLAGWTGGCSTATGTSCTIVISAQRAAGVSFSRPAVAPVVQTDAADQITNSSARLNGRINQDGGPYTTWFEFGPSPTLTPLNITSASSGPTTNCPGTVTCIWSTTLPGQPAGTILYFRMVAENAAGQSRGAIRSFMTLPNAAAPTISSVSTSVVATNTTSCTFSDGGTGTLIAHTFSFTDPNSDVSFTGSPVLATFTFQPSGDTGNFTEAVVSSTGTGSSGSITFRHCWRFISDASFTITVQLRDAAGNNSNALTASVTKPPGANSVKPLGARESP